MTEPFPLESVRTVPEHNGRYVYTYASGPEPGRDGVHVWDVSPTNAPAVDTYTDEWGKTRTIYYDPARVQPTRGRFGHEWNSREMPGASVEALDDVPEGLLWRGMSDEEYQAARQNGYFESNGSYNIGDDQKGLTFFSTGIDHAGNYANGFAPSQHQAGFGKPAHVVGIPMRPWDWELEHEKGIRGRIPFSDVTHHYVGHAYAIKPGEERVYEDYMGRQPMGGGIGGVFVQWEPDHPADPGIPVPTAEESWKEASKYFFAWSPSTYTYRGPKVRPATSLPEGFADTSDYNYTGSAETQYHHRSLTPEVMKGIDKRKDNIDAYYEEMRQRREQGLNNIPWEEWLDRVAFIRSAMAWEDWAPHVRNDFYNANTNPNDVGHHCEQGGCTYQAGDENDDRAASAYWIDHGHGNGGSFLTFNHLPGNRIAVGVLDTDIRYRRDGVAEAMLRRLVEDHPGAKIIPGNMTPPGKKFHDRMLEKEPEARELVTAASLLVGPEDAYDEWEWFGQREQFPPVSADVSHEEWYHVSPHRIPEGTTLAPMRGQTPWNDDPYDSGLQNRANWIWLEYDKARARDWMHYILQHQPECFIYRVDPDLGPFAWNGTADEGWVTNRAVVVELLDRISRDLSFEEQSR